MFIDWGLIPKTRETIVSMSRSRFKYQLLIGECQGRWEDGVGDEEGVLDQ